MLCQLNSHPQKCPSASIVASASLIQLLCIWEKNERYVMMCFSFLFLSCSAFCGLIGNKIHYLLVLSDLFCSRVDQVLHVFPFVSCAVCGVMFVIQHAACTLSIQMPPFNIYYSESARCSTCHLFHASIEFNCIFNSTFLCFILPI